MICVEVKNGCVVEVYSENPDEMYVVLDRDTDGNDDTVRVAGTRVCRFFARPCDRLSERVRSDVARILKEGA